MLQSLKDDAAVQVLASAASRKRLGRRCCTTRALIRGRGMQLQPPSGHGKCFELAEGGGGRCVVSRVRASVLSHRGLLHVVHHRQAVWCK